MCIDDRFSEERWIVLYHPHIIFNILYFEALFGKHLSNVGVLVKILYQSCQKSRMCRERFLSRSESIPLVEMLEAERGSYAFLFQEKQKPHHWLLVVWLVVFEPQTTANTLHGHLLVQIDTQPLRQKTSR